MIEGASIVVIDKGGSAVCHGFYSGPWHIVDGAFVNSQSVTVTPVDGGGTTYSFAMFSLGTGALIGVAPLSRSNVVKPNDQCLFAAGALRLTLDPEPADIAAAQRYAPEMFGRPGRWGPSA